MVEKAKYSCFTKKSTILAKLYIFSDPILEQLCTEQNLEYKISQMKKRLTTLPKRYLDNLKSLKISLREKV